jgi:two-component system nitrogen regulation sensor histidine kinase GlnL
MEPHWPYKQAESVPDIESYSLAVGKRLGMNFDAGALGLVWVALLNAGIGIYILRRNPWAPINRAFTFMALAIALWTTAIALTYNTDLSPTLILRLSFAAGSMIPFGVVTFVEQFTAAARPTSKHSARLCAALSVGFVLLSFSPLIVLSVSREPSGPRTIYGPLHVLFAIHVVAWFSWAVYLLVRTHKSSSGLVRLTARQLLVAFGVSSGLATLTNVIVPLIFRTSALGRYGPFFSILLLAMVGHTIIRHRLMDIRVVIRRSFAYLVAMICAAGFFVLLLIGSNMVLPDEHDFSTREILLVLIAAVLFQPVKSHVQDLFERYLYRDPYDYVRTLREASRALSATIELQALLRHASEVLMSTLRPSRIAIYLLDQDDHEFRLAWNAGVAELSLPVSTASLLVITAPSDRRIIFRDEPANAQAVEHRDKLLVELDLLRAEVVVPLLEGDETIGLLVLGAKRSGDPYFDNDADLLSTLANQAAVAFRNAQTHTRVLQINEEMQKVLETIESGVVAVGPRGKITLFNQAAERLTGISAQSVRGQPIHHLPDALTRVLLAAAGGELTTPTEFALPDASGQLIPLLCSTSPLSGPDGMSLGAVAVLADMSRLKELEQEKRRAERLASIEAIASGLIHEIRNPLVGLKTYAQLLPSRGTNEEFRDMFSRTANREIDRIDELLSRFRTISRASQQPMELMDVSATLRDTLETLHAEMEDRKIQLRRVGEATRRPVIGNATQLQQLFLNLCLNAIQAMDPGGELTVRVADLSEGGGSTLLVEVADTGPGIADDLLPTIFDPFVTTKPHGTGLGLAICRGIADAHHARVSARNNVGRAGCTFTVEFPVPSGRPARLAP